MLVGSNFENYYVSRANEQLFFFFFFFFAALFFSSSFFFKYSSDNEIFPRWYLDKEIIIPSSLHWSIVY